jgi:hypothetical protein
MTAEKSRIPSEPNKFVAYMDATDDYQLSIDPDNAPNLRYQKFGWTLAESGQWTLFRQEADTLFIKYNDENFVNSTIRKQMMQLIETVNDYDHDKITGHHLLDKVAMTGNIEDCTKFRVIRGSVLQDDNPTEAPELGARKPLLSVRKNTTGEHELSVTNPDTPESKALPEGVAAARVYRAIAAADQPVPDKSVFAFAGPAKRGHFISRLDDLTLDPNKKYYAYYYGSYVSTTQQEGDTSEIVKAMIVE